MWDLKSTHERSVTILEDESRIEGDRVVVDYGTMEAMPTGVFVSKLGRATCALGPGGTVGVNKHLCYESQVRPKVSAADPSVKELLQKYSWLRREIQGKLAPGESLSKVKPFADLNDDGVPELINMNSGYCKATNCHYKVYQIDTNTRSVRTIFDEEGVSGKESPTLVHKNGWKLVVNKWCSLDSCACFVNEFDSKQQEYVATERYELVDPD